MKRSDPYLLDDFNRIITAVEKMGENGILERFFRNEGKMKDRVYAIPTAVKKKPGTKIRSELRLYCLHLFDKLLIIGNGGVKSVDVYQKDKYLKQCVETLQKIDKKLISLEREGYVIENEIPNIILAI